jgi:hypothetical protein
MYINLKAIDEVIEELFMIKMQMKALMPGIEGPI